MTFAVTGLALGLFGWLILRTTAFPRTAGRLALAAAVLLVVVYVARLTVVDPKTNAIRVAALASGLVLVPAVLSPDRTGAPPWRRTTCAATSGTLRFGREGSGLTVTTRRHGQSLSVNRSTNSAPRPATPC